MALTLPVESVPAVPPLAGPQPTSVAPPNGTTPADKSVTAQPPVPAAVAV